MGKGWMMLTMDTPHQRSAWEWVYRKWRPVSYRLKNAVYAVFESNKEGGRWGPTGEGRELRFERIIDRESDQWPYDREVIEVYLDVNGSLKGVHRYKQIYVERGKSHDDLYRMLGLKEKR